MEVRECCGCGKTHPLTTEFFIKAKAYKGKPNFTYRCKVCTNAKNREKSLAKRLSSEKHKIKMREETTKLRVCKICGVEKALTLFQARKRTCNLCRQVERNGGRPSIPKVGPSQTLVEVDGETYKQCSTCRGSKKLKAFNKDRNSLTGYAHGCRRCASERKRKDYATRPETRIAKRAWDTRNKAKVKEQEKIRKQRYYAKPEVKARRAEWLESWKLDNAERLVARSKKRAVEMPEAYIKQLLCAGVGGKHIAKSKWPEIPAELIEAKRLQLLITRKVKENK